MSPSASSSVTLRPVSVSSEGPVTDEIRELVAVRNAVEAHTFGTSALARTPEELLQVLSDDAQRRCRHVAAWRGTTMVGRSLLILPRSPGSREARGIVDVLPDERGAGVGTVLLIDLERAAASEGRSTFRADVVHTAPRPGGPAMVPATGLGEISRSDAGARFLARHGYTLEQVLLVSALELGLRTLEADLTAPASEDDYVLHAWEGATPRRWIADLASLKTVMSTAAPSGELTVTEVPWSVDDLGERDERMTRQDRRRLTVVAEHAPTGRLVGLTEIEVPADDRPAVQEDTLVLPEHRGHGLGLRMKRRNLLELRHHAAASASVLTFNAAENRPMLAVNETLGFRPIGCEGAWQKRRDA